MVAPQIASMKPPPSLYPSDFIAADQKERADDVLPGTNKAAHVEQVRNNIRDFKTTASTLSSPSAAPTRSAAPTLSPASTTWPAKAVEQIHPQVSLSPVFAMACIL
ncbi:hypothetical protein V8E36_007357 [Tilletia maclaganii]